MYKIGLPALAIVFVMLWSSGWTAAHYAATTSSALSILSARYVMVVALLLIIITLLRQWQRIPLHELLLHLLIGALCHALYLLGNISAFKLGVSAAVVAFINALQPMATACIAGVITGEQIQTRHFKGLFLGILSVVLIVSESYYHLGVSSIALTLPFIAMLALSAGLALSRRQELYASTLNRKARPVMMLLLMHTVGAAMIIVPLAAIKGELQWQFTSTQWSAVLWLATVVSVGSYGLLLVLLRHVSAVGVSSLTYLVPPATMLQSYLFFGDNISLTDAIALCIASIAVYLILSGSCKDSGLTLTSAGSARVARLRLDWLARQPKALSHKQAHQLIRRYRRS